MKKMFFSFAVLATMFLMVGCGGSESNGCKDLYDCYNDCYNNVHAGSYCREDCRSVATNNDLNLYDLLENCQERWEELKDYGETSQTLKQYCAAEYKSCGM